MTMSIIKTSMGEKEQLLGAWRPMKGGKSGSRLGLSAWVRLRLAFQGHFNYKAGPAWVAL